MPCMVEKPENRDSIPGATLPEVHGPKRRGSPYTVWAAGMAVYMVLAIVAGIVLAHYPADATQPVRMGLWVSWLLSLAIGVLGFVVAVTRGRGKQIRPGSLLVVIIMTIGALVGAIVPGIPVRQFYKPGWVRNGPLSWRESAKLALPWAFWGVVCGALSGIYFHDHGFLSTVLFGGIFLAVGLIGWGRYEGLLP